MSNKLAIAVAVVGISALSFAAVVAMRDRGASKPEVKTTAGSTTLTSLESVPRITLAAFREKMDRGEIVVLDVRDIDSYTASHIPGALHIPVSYIESELPYLPRGKPTVAYCT